MGMSEPTYKRYLLGVLLVVLACNAVDRLALGLVMQDIKTDLALSDTQLGLLTGIAFALFYATMGIPIARWADRGNRVTILSLTTALWRAAVAWCALAGNCYQLILIRISAAIGEAGCLPPAHSLIADHFTRAERPRALAIYMLGVPLAALIGYLLAGWLNEVFGWRVMFVVLGLPGLALAVLVKLTLREPRLTKPKTTTASRIDVRPSDVHESVITPQQQPRLDEVARVLWANTTFRHLLMSFSVLFLFSYGVAQWKPTFFIRTYGMQTGELGTWLALITGVGGALGTFVGGELATRFAANNERLQLKLMSFTYICFGVTSALLFLSPNQYWAFGFMAVGSVGGVLGAAPLFAMIQTLVPPQMRATALAILYLFINLIGMGFGTLLVGALSDALHPVFGDDSLRYALLAVCPGFAWAALHLWLASKSVEKDLHEVQFQAELARAAQDEPDEEH